MLFLFNPVSNCKELLRGFRGFTFGLISPVIQRYDTVGLALRKSILPVKIE